MHLRRIVITSVLCLSVFHCEYLQNIERPPKAPKDSPLTAEQAEAVFQGQNAEKLYLTDKNLKFKINEILIFNRPISEKDELIPNFINFFHWATEKSILRSQITFHEGETVKIIDIKESERILRLIPSVKTAAIYLKKHDDGLHDAYVYTTDRITNSIQYNLELSGGYSYLLLGIGERNLFGRLYNITATYERENFVNALSLFARKSRIAGTAWGIGAIAKRKFTDEGVNYGAHAISLQKPLLSLRDRWSFSLSAGQEKGVVYRFLGSGIETRPDPDTNVVIPLVFGRQKQNWGFDYLHVWGRHRRLELGGGYAQVKDNFEFADISTLNSTSPTAVTYSDAARAAYLPLVTNAQILKFRLNLKDIAFKTRKNFNRFFFVEDVRTGISLNNSVNHAIPGFGFNDHYTEFSTAFSYVYDQQNLRNAISVGRSARKLHSDSGNFVNDKFTLENRLYYFFKYGVYANRLVYGQGNHLNRDFQFSFGGEYVRGFVKNSQIGSFNYLISNEYRTPPWYFWYFAIGGVAFVDVGEVRTTLPSGLNQLKPEASVGVGLRSTVLEFDNSLFRVDIAIPVTKSFSFSDLLTQVSFGLSHVF